MLTLFEVVKEVDAGPYYIKDIVEYNGSEMLPELRYKMASKINSMALKYIKEYSSIKPIIASSSKPACFICRAVISINLSY